MSNAHLPKDTVEPSAPVGGDQLATGTQSLLNTLLSRIGLRSPSLRELLEADLRGEAEAEEAAFSTEEREMLRRLLRSRHRLLKPLLLDQHVIAGIGNIYADEILHEARLRPDRMSDELGPPAERRLHAAIHRVLEAAIAAGGSTLGDAQYVDLYGEWGSYQEAHKVYGRAGERCLTCGVGWVRRTVSAQRSTHYCPRCQR